MLPLMLLRCRQYYALDQLLSHVFYFVALFCIFRHLYVSLYFAELFHFRAMRRFDAMLYTLPPVSDCRRAYDALICHAYALLDAPAMLIRRALFFLFFADAADAALPAAADEIFSAR